MLNAFGEIFSILGIILFAIFLLVLIFFLLILFFPVSYRIDLIRKEMTKVSVKLSWLFGILSIRFQYPEPGKLLIYLLGCKLYGGAKDVISKKGSEDTAILHENTKTTQNTGTSDFRKPQQIESAETESGNYHKKQDAICNKIDKIKYTIRNIYDKMKSMTEQITFYKDILSEEDTKGLLAHAIKRLLKIGKGIIPGSKKVDIIYGTGSPDTTGYLYGIYGMFSPKLGRDIKITPDFSEKIFEGEMHVSGHITVIRLLYHTALFMMDKRLKRLISKLKKHNGSIEPKIN